MRKAFNFFRSYWQIGNELKDKERLEYYDALLHYQFTGDKSKIDALVGMSKFALISQSHSIESQIKGYIDICKRLNVKPFGIPNPPPAIGGEAAPAIQVEVEGKVEEEVQDVCSFSNFWKLYENKKNKVKAEKAWSKLSLHEKQKIFATLPDFLKSISDKKFIPHPTTYLNGKRWEDELEQPKKTKEFKTYLDPETNKW